MTTIPHTHDTGLPQPVTIHQPKKFLDKIILPSPSLFDTAGRDISPPSKTKTVELTELPGHHPPGFTMAMDSTGTVRTIPNRYRLDFKARTLEGLVKDPLPAPGFKASEDDHQAKLPKNLRT